VFRVERGAAFRIVDPELLAFPTHAVDGVAVATGSGVRVGWTAESTEGFEVHRRWVWERSFRPGPPSRPRVRSVAEVGGVVA
jgi:hypothetical protein